MLSFVIRDNRLKPPVHKVKYLGNESSLITAAVQYFSHLKALLSSLVAHSAGNRRSPFARFHDRFSPSVHLSKERVHVILVSNMLTDYRTFVRSH